MCHYGHVVLPQVMKHRKPIAPPKLKQAVLGAVHWLLEVQVGELKQVIPVVMQAWPSAVWLQVQDGALLGQTTPQAPQFWLVLRSVHAPPQQPCPAWQALPQEPQLFVSIVVLTQLPEQHVWPAHTLPQAPQLFASVAVLTQLPEQHV